MIDDKKIEEAAKQHSEKSYISGYFQACYKDAFTEGAKWAINELLKNLWHPASEIPKEFNYYGFTALYIFPIFLLITIRYFFLLNLLLIISFGGMSDK